MSEVALRSRNWFGRKDLDGFAHRSWIKAEGFSDLDVRRPPRDRHRELVVRADELQRASPQRGGGGEARRALRGRLPARVPHDLAGRGPDEADHHALPQPHGDGRGGVHPRLSARRRRAALGLRQDHAGHADGRGLRRRARHHGHRRAHAARHGATRSSSAPAPTPGALWAERRAGRLTEEEFCEIEACISRSAGHCMVMGTASTMASMARGARHDAARQCRHPRAGLAAPGAGRDGRPPHRRDGAARTSSRRRSSPREAFDNAIRADMAIGGSTNAIVHLVAIAGRAGVPLPLTRFDELSRTHAASSST